MQSFTYMSDEALAATIVALPDHYPMTLNPTDVAGLRQVLTTVYGGWDNWPANLDAKRDLLLARPDMGDLLWACQEAWREHDDEWAGDFASSIAATVDIEMV